jgi:hypothetical protein
VRRTVGLFCALALAGCAESGKLVEQSVTAKDVPIHFAYGSLRDAGARYSGAESGWSGMPIRRATYRAGGEFATFDTVRFVGNYGVARRSVSSWIGDMLKKAGPITWGGSGELLGDAHPVEYQAFLLPGAKASCVGLERVLSDYPDTGSGSFAQSMLVGFYCRQGTEPIVPDEARRIAGAVHV